MRAIILSAAFAVFASPALAVCSSAAVGSLPEQMAAQTEALLCQQRELTDDANARYRQLQLEAEIKSQQILLEEELKFQQEQLAALNATSTP